MKNRPRKEVVSKMTQPSSRYQRSPDGLQCWGNRRLQGCFLSLSKQGYKDALTADQADTLCERTRAESLQPWMRQEGEGRELSLRAFW